MASSYVSIVATAPNVVHQPLIDGWLSEHGLLHLWLTPYRMYCMGVSSQGCSLPAGEKGILKYLLFGETLAKFGNEQSFMVQVMMGVPILALFGSLYALEAMFGAALAPLALLLGAGCLVRRGKASAEKVKTV